MFACGRVFTAIMTSTGSTVDVAVVLSSGCISRGLLPPRSFQIGTVCPKTQWPISIVVSRGW
jgi:hypothetical protein